MTDTTDRDEHSDEAAAAVAAARPVSDLPPDPEAYDSPRAVRARAKGLEAPYIAGGEAPDAVEARAEDRRLWRLLVIMVIAIVAAGFVLGIIAAILAPVLGP